MGSGTLRTLFVMLQLALIVSTEPSTDDLVYTMEHDLGTGPFSNRGNIQLPGAKRKDAEVTVAQEELDQDEIRSLDSRNGHGLYRLKIDVPSSTDDNSTLVMGFTCMNELKAASFRDTITLYTDEIGNVISVKVRAISGIPETRHSTEFTTVLSTQTPSPAPVPDTAGYLDKLREEKLQKEQEEKNPKSFIGKYWMYLLPVVMFMFMSNAAQQQQGA